MVYPQSVDFIGRVSGHRADALHEHGLDDLPHAQRRMIDGRERGLVF